MGKVTTSSFPSRAVTCGVVLGFIIIEFLEENEWLSHIENKHMNYIYQILIIAGMFILSSFARMHLGVHFPSDCIGGLF